jgi:hypothetical protein
MASPVDAVPRADLLERVGPADGATVRRNAAEWPSPFASCTGIGGTSLEAFFIKLASCFHPEGTCSGFAWPNGNRFEEDAEHESRFYHSPGEAGYCLGVSCFGPGPRWSCNYVLGGQGDWLTHDDGASWLVNGTEQLPDVDPLSCPPLAELLVPTCSGTRASSGPL